MNRIFKLVSFTVFFTGLMQTSFSQTTVFFDNFNRTSLNSSGIYTIVAGSGTVNTVVNTAPDSCLNMLGVQSPATGIAEKHSVVGSFSFFNSAFNNTLANNTGDVTWSFNMKVGKSLSTAFTNSAGTSVQNASGVVLVSTASDLSASGSNGYVVYMRATSSGSTSTVVCLAKFTNGLNGSGTNKVSDLDTSLPLTLGTSWASIKVIYTPFNNNWTFYVKDEILLSGTPSDPSLVNAASTNLRTSPIGTVINNSSYTNVAMSNFGFMWAHTNTNNAATNARYDNFKVTVAPSVLFLNPTSLTFPSTDIGASSVIKGFTIDSALSVGSNLVITPKTNDFQLSTDSITFATGPLTVAPTSGSSVYNKRIYVKFTPVAGNYNKDTLSFSNDVKTLLLKGTLKKYYIYSPGLAQGAANLSAWRGRSDYTGAAIPHDFTSDSVTYYVWSDDYCNASWTVAGAGTKIVIGDPSKPGVFFRTRTAGKLTTVSPVVIDMPSASSGANVLYLSDTTSDNTTPRFGTLDANSEVHFRNSSSFAQSATFGKLFIDSTKNTSFSQIQTIQSVFKVDSTATATMSGCTNCYVALNSGALLVVNGTLKVYKDYGFTANNLGSPSSANKGFQFLGNENIILGSRSTIGYYRTTSNAQTIDARTDYVNLVLSGISNDKIFAAGSTLVSGNLIDSTTGGSVVSLGGDTRAKNVYLYDTLQVGSNTLTIDSAFTGNSYTSSNNVVAAQGGLYCNGSSNLVLNGTAGTIRFISGGRDIRNLSLGNNANVTLGDSLYISGGTNYGSVSVGSSATLNTSGWLTLRSNDLGTARIGTVNGSILGNATIERYLQNKKAWRLLSMPTNHDAATINQSWMEGGTSNNDPVNGYGIQITGPGGVAAGFDAVSAQPSMKYLDPSTNQWVGISTTNANFENQKAYMVFVRGNRSVTSFGQSSTSTILREQGSLKTGTVNYTNLGTGDGQYVGIGNPYASPISLSNILSTNLDKSYYLWDPALTGTSGYGAYQQFSVDGSGVVSVAPGGGSYGANKYVESGQGFLVHTSGGVGSITFNETDKVNASNLVSRQNSQIKSIRANLIKKMNGTNVLVDGVLNLYDSSYSNLIDIYDTKKILNPNENLSLSSTTNLLAIERRMNVSELDTVFFAVSNLKTADYQFEFTPEFMQGYKFEALLLDNYLRTQIPVSLVNQTIVDFSVTNDAASFASNRFMLVFKPSVSLPVRNIITKASKKQEGVLISWQVEGQEDVVMYQVEKSADGKCFSKIGELFASKSLIYSHEDPHPLSTNYYRVIAVSKSGLKQYSNVVLISMDEVKASSFSVVPNPVSRENGLHIECKNVPVGLYQISIQDFAAKKLGSSSIKVMSNTKKIDLPIASNIPSGAYLLNINGENFNNSFTIIIQ